MATLYLADLITKITKTQIYDRAIAIATTLGLPTTSWFTGDPTRSMYYVLSELLETLEDIVGDYISSGFLELAPEGWLPILAYQVYGYEATEATWATCTMELTNAGGGVYTIEAGDLTVKNSATGTTYHSTTAVTILSGPGATATVEVVADIAGSDGTSSIGDIDEMVTTYLGVTCSNTTASVGLDAEDSASIIAGCRAKLGSMSPNGPKDAYNYVAKNSTLTGTTAVTRARSYGDTDTGDVTLYLAGADGTVDDPADVALVEDAIILWATPLCITPTVLAATEVTVNVTYHLYVYNSVNQTESQIKAAVAAALLEMFAQRPIGGDAGYLKRSKILSTIERTFEQTFDVTVSVPAADTALTEGQVAKLGTPTGTIHFVEDP
jgi:uncharacterized phage protein gp47/JayE